MKTTLKKEIEPLLLMIASVIVFSLLTIFGMIYNVLKSFYEIKNYKDYRLKGILVLPMVIFLIIEYWVKVLYQFWNVVKYFMMKIAISIDLFGNVAGGELVEDCVTTKEDTWYGKGEHTVSAATGKLEQHEELNKFGLKFTKLLSKVLGKNHSLDAYYKEIKK